MPAPALVLLERLLASLDGLHDGDEPVDERSHALLCADLARRRGARPELVAAALLHDVGRSPLVRAAHPGRPHEEAGADFLRPILGEEVSWLVAMHVQAKVHLVRAEPGYGDGLSPTSAASHERQARRLGESPTDHPLWPDALVLRRLDDAAKDPEATLPEPGAILATVATLVRGRIDEAVAHAGRSTTRQARDDKRSSPCIEPVENGSDPLPTITAKGRTPFWPTRAERDLEV